MSRVVRVLCSVTIMPDEPLGAIIAAGTLV